MSPAGGPTIEQSAAVFAALTVTGFEAGNGTLPKLQVKRLPPACGLVPVQLAASVPPTVQFLVAGPGRVSVIETPVAATGPLFVVTIVKTALLPALTVPGAVASLSGVFVT